MCRRPNPRADCTSTAVHRGPSSARQGRRRVALTFCCPALPLLRSSTTSPEVAGRHHPAAQWVRRQPRRDRKLRLDSPRARTGQAAWKATESSAAMAASDAGDALLAGVVAAAATASAAAHDRAVLSAAETAVSAAAEDDGALQTPGWVERQTFAAIRQDWCAETVQLLASWEKVAAFFVERSPSPRGARASTAGAAPPRTPRCRGESSNETEHYHHHLGPSKRRLLPPSSPKSGRCRAVSRYSCSDGGGRADAAPLSSQFGQLLIPCGCRLALERQTVDSVPVARRVGVLRQTATHTGEKAGAAECVSGSRRLPPRRITHGAPWHPCARRRRALLRRRS